MAENKFVQIKRQSKFDQADFRDLIIDLNKAKLQGLLEPQIPIEGLSVKVSNNIATPSSEPIPDCLTCGACCAFQLCIPVKPTDLTPKNYFWQITKEKIFDDVIVDQFMRRDVDKLACALLEGKLGEKVRCQIHEQRPQFCREFEAGSDKCHAVRRVYRIEPLLTNEKALEANFRLELFKSIARFTEKLVYSEIISHPETEDLLIVGILENGSKQPLYIYNPSKEKWLQAEFAGLTIAEAFSLIRSRNIKADGN